MKNKAVAAAILVSICLSGLQPALGCGPYTMSVLFRMEKYPDLPMDPYLAGNVGIVPNSFGQMSLVLFYRELNGLGLNANERIQAKNAIRNRVFYLPGPEDPSNPKSTDEPEITAEAKWLIERAKVTGEKVEIDKERRSGYAYYSNCLPDAFRTAAKTLEDRITKYGVGDDTKEWLKGQDAVFANCSDDAALPTELSSGPDWLRWDRKYQIAAATLYQGKSAEARALFSAIGNDIGSPWKGTARFVAARTYVREASFVSGIDEREPDPTAIATRSELLQNAITEFEQLLKDPAMSEFHSSAARLIGLSKFRMTPEERRKELSNVLASGSNNPNLYNDLTDFGMLHRRSTEIAEEAGRTREQKEAEQAGRDYDYQYKLKLQDVPVSARADELSDWIFTYRSVDGFDHAYAKWKETRARHWFVAAITKVRPNSPGAEDLLAEAEQTKPDSKGFATVRYHQIRLLAESGKRESAKAKLDSTSGIDSMPLSAKNAFLAQKALFATDLSEFLKYAQRKPVIFTWDDYGSQEPAEPDQRLAAWKNREMFDSDSAAVFNNKVPLPVLKQAATSEALPEHLKRMIAIAAWTRAFVIKDSVMERELAPIVAKHTKEDMPLFSSYAATRGTSAREAAALLAVLRYPVVGPYVETGYGREDSEPTSIDSIRGNWWCNESHKNAEGDVKPEFLTQQNAAAGEQEAKKLHALGEGATYLAKRAVEFAAKNPGNTKTPEILHLAVRATRYGCTDENTGRYSKQAFDLLHKRYKNSAWTKRTPYWFGQ